MHQLLCPLLHLLKHPFVLLPERFAISGVSGVSGSLSGMAVIKSCSKSDAPAAAPPPLHLLNTPRPSSHTLLLYPGYPGYPGIYPGYPGYPGIYPGRPEPAHATCNQQPGCQGAGGLVLPKQPGPRPPPNKNQQMDGAAWELGALRLLARAGVAALSSRTLAHARRGLHSLRL
jgi:hypothetical protein